MRWQIKYTHLVPYINLTITQNGFSGTYSGPEFGSGHGGDWAHQFCNVASDVIGNKLKSLYRSGNYSKVNLSNIKMTTSGMTRSRNVVFYLSIPFTPVSNKCEAYTSFDHRGGWGHNTSPRGPQFNKLDDLKSELGNAPLQGTELDISNKYETPEGLVEYFTQWKNKNTQKDCVGKTSNQPPSRQVEVDGNGVPLDEMMGTPPPKDTPPISDKKGEIDLDLPETVTIEQLEKLNGKVVTISKEGYQDAHINPYSKDGTLRDIDIVELKSNEEFLNKSISESSTMSDEQVDALLKPKKDPEYYAQKRLLDQSQKLKEKVIPTILKPIVMNFGITDPQGLIEDIKEIKEKGKIEEDQKEDATLSGYVTDINTGEALWQTKIYVPELKSGTLSDENGFYSITLKKGKYDIQFRGIENTITENLSILSDTNYNVQLGTTTEIEEVNIIGVKEEEEIKEKEVEKEWNNLSEETKEIKYNSSLEEFKKEKLPSKFGIAAAGAAAGLMVFKDPIQQKIMELIQQNMGSSAPCPDKETLDKIIEIKNSLVPQLNNVMKVLDVTTKALGVTAGIIKAFEAIFQILKFSPIPIPSFAPVSLVGLIEDAKKFADEDIIKKLGSITTSTLGILLIVRQVLVQVLDLLNLLDMLIQHCYGEQGNNEENSQSLSKELLALQAQQQIVNSQPIVLEVNGFKMEIETETTENPLKRKRAIAVDPGGVAILKGEWSFSSIEQILIDELVFYIQTNDLKAD